MDLPCIGAVQKVGDCEPKKRLSGAGGISVRITCKRVAQFSGFIKGKARVVLLEGQHSKSSTQTKRCAFFRCEGVLSCFPLDAIFS